MSPFSFHVPASHYRRRPSVRLAVATREPFRRDNARLVLAVVVGLQFVWLIAGAVFS